MYRRTKDFITRRCRDLSVRLSYWNLPPLATHIACFLLGTLVFEPNRQGLVPHRGILVPWSEQRLKGGLHFAADYSLVSSRKNCLMAPDTLKIWQAEEKKLFVILPKDKKAEETFTALSKSEAVLALKTNERYPLCERASGAILYN